MLNWSPCTMRTFEFVLSRFVLLPDPVCVCEVLIKTQNATMAPVLSPFCIQILSPNLFGLSCEIVLHDRVQFTMFFGDKNAQSFVRKIRDLCCLWLQKQCPWRGRGRCNTHGSSSNKPSEIYTYIK